MKKTRLATILSLLLVCICSLAAFTLTACDGGVKVSFSQTEINVTEGLKTSCDGCAHRQNVFGYRR